MKPEAARLHQCNSQALARSQHLLFHTVIWRMALVPAESNEPFFTIKISNGQPVAKHSFSAIGRNGIILDNNLVVGAGARRTRLAIASGRFV